MNRKIKKTLKLICPPILFNLLKSGKKILSPGLQNKKLNNSKIKGLKIDRLEDPKQQDLGLYWNEKFAQVLDEWGRDNVWNEIQLLLAPCKGKVLDIACGTGITMEILKKYENLSLYGVDISELLINKALEKGILEERLKVADATLKNYEENEFNYSFSIGSLEHFTEEGIEEFIVQASFYTKHMSFHMVPISRNNKNEGWVKTTQSFFNNTEDWWYKKFSKNFNKVYAVPSKWEDEISLGRWFICVNTYN